MPRTLAKVRLHTYTQHAWPPALGCAFTAHSVGMALGLSLAFAAVLVLTWWGASINTMVLAGLVIALGEVVDDAIIDVENIVRRLRLNGELPTPLSAYQVVLDASLEVRSSVVYASLIVTLVFLPIFFSVSQSLSAAITAMP